MTFAVLFLYFQKPHILVLKKLKQFLLHCTSICHTNSVSLLKKCVSDFKVLFQTGGINTFVFPGIFFGRYVQLKSSFSDKENLHAVKFYTQFCREAFKVENGKLLMERSIMKHYTGKANADVPLTKENVYF